jgi:chromate transporter
VFGRQIAGSRGAAVAFAGLVGPGFAIMAFFAFLYGYFGDLAVLRKMFTGVAAAAAGLTISTSAKMALPMIERRLGAPALIALAVLFAVGVMHWPIYWVLGVAVPISIALALRSRA